MPAIAALTLGVQVVPADLNAWLYQLERNIAWAANATGDAATSERFNAAADARRAAMDALLWDEAAGAAARGGGQRLHGDCCMGGAASNTGPLATQQLPAWLALTPPAPQASGATAS